MKNDEELGVLVRLAMERSQGGRVILRRGTFERRGQRLQTWKATVRFMGDNVQGSSPTDPGEALHRACVKAGWIGA